MILNTYLKKKCLLLNNTQKSWLGKSIMRCYKSINEGITDIKKVSISQEGIKMEVVDYPNEFLESDKVVKIVKRFVKKHNIPNQEPFNVKKIKYGKDDK